MLLYLAYINGLMVCVCLCVCVCVKLVSILLYMYIVYISVIDSYELMNRILYACFVSKLIIG